MCKNIYIVLPYQPHQRQFGKSFICKLHATTPRSPIILSIPLQSSCFDNGVLFIIITKSHIRLHFFVVVSLVTSLHLNGFGFFFHVQFFELFFLVIGFVHSFIVDYLHLRPSPSCVSFMCL